MQNPVIRIACPLKKCKQTQELSETYMRIMQMYKDDKGNVVKMRPSSFETDTIEKLMIEHYVTH